MRILFSSLGSHGHTYPLIPFAVAARDAGHEVVFATGANFHPTLAGAGLTPVDAGMSFRAAFRAVPGRVDTAEQRDRTIGQVFGMILPRQFLDDIGRMLRERPGFDLVVHEAGNFGAGFAAKLAGVPGVCHGFGRMGMRNGPGACIVETVNEFAAELGFPDRDGSSNVLGDPFLDIYPPSLQEPEFRARPERIELRPVPFAEPGALPAIVTSRSRPLVYLTLGTAFGAAEVLRGSIAGLAALDVHVLVATGPAVAVAELGDLPDNVTVESWLPQADLLEHVDLVVHHGGAGTTLAALGAGVKQLVLPQGADQFINAEVIVAAGAATQLQPVDFSVEAMTAVAEELLFRDRTDLAVRALAKEITEMPSPAEIAVRLPSFI